MMRLLAAACLLILVGSAGDTYVAAEARLQHTAAGGSMQLGGGSAQQRRHLLASGSVGGGSIAGEPAICQIPCMPCLHSKHATPPSESNKATFECPIAAFHNPCWHLGPAPAHRFRAA